MKSVPIGAARVSFDVLYSPAVAFPERAQKVSVGVPMQWILFEYLLLFLAQKFPHADTYIGGSTEKKRLFKLGFCKSPMHLPSGKHEQGLARLLLFS